MISKRVSGALMILTGFAIAATTQAQTPGTTAAGPDSAAATAPAPVPVMAAPLMTSVTPTAPDFPRLKVSGLMFADLYENLTGSPTHAYNSSGADSGQTNIDGKTPITRDLNGFQLRRVYLQVDDDLSIRVSCRVRLEADGKAVSSDGKQTTFIKSAYVQFRQVYPHADAFVGITQTPTFENSENFWAYRSVEKTIADFHGVASASDGGFSVKGYVDASHVLGYFAMLGNGMFQKPEVNRDKRSYLALPIQWHDFHFEPYVDYENVPAHKDIATYKVFASYEFKRVAVGYEQLERVIHDPVAPYRVQRGYSGFARGSLRPGQLNAYARYDVWQTNTNTPNRVDSDLWIAGLDWQPTKDLHIEPNFEGTQYRAKGNAVAPAFHDVQARLTVYILFR